MWRLERRRGKGWRIDGDRVNTGVEQRLRLGGDEVKTGVETAVEEK